LNSICARPSEAHYWLSAAVEGDVLDAAAVAAAVAGQNAVLIALGTGSDLRATTVLSGGTANILTAVGIAA
jgi:hypothetical protein